MGAIRHGGDLSDARARAAHVTEWLDLSTGINPHAYPACVPAASLTVLPQAEDIAILLRAARRAYGVPEGAAVVAAPGTQAILQWLPQILPARRVAVVGPTYAEHEATWARRSGIDRVPSLSAAGEADLVVLCNPNNPDGRRIPPAALRAAAAARGRNGVGLVIDEAFADVDPELSVAGAPGTLVLRSFGKFYGLPGLRLGFAVGAPDVVDALASALGPWAVSGPALAVGAEALADRRWADAMRARLASERAELDRLLEENGLPVTGGTDLFRLVETPDASRWHAALAAEGVWTRAFDHSPDWLRIGLPGPDLSRLETALAAARARL